MMIKNRERVANEYIDKIFVNKISIFIVISFQKNSI